jgi:hypothetical protein
MELYQDHWGGIHRVKALVLDGEYPASNSDAAEPALSA